MELPVQTRFRALLALLALATAGAVWITGEPDAFGLMHDDSLYWSAAKSLADGEGYVIAGLPGEPEQTKYPPAFSWLLSLVWRLSPEFPQNVEAALTLCALFGGGLVFAAGLVLRQLGLGAAEALITAAVFAFHPITLFWSGQLMSDVLFGALGVAAVALADRSNRERPDSWGLVALVAAALWATSLTRSLGAAFAVGAALAALLRGRRLAAAAWLSACLPLGFSVVRSLGAGDGPPADGYDQTLLYYLSYGGYWKFCVPDWAAFVAQFNRLSLELLKHPAVAVFFLPAVGFASPTMQTSSIAVSAGILFGVVGRLRAQPSSGAWWGLDRLHPYHWAALAYLPFVLVWNYALMSRFWLPFLPLLLAGAGFEMRRLYQAIGKSLRAPAVGDRIAAALFVVLLAALPAYGAWRYLFGARTGLQATFEQRAALLPDKQAAYRWLEENSDPGDRLVAYEDVAAYLYTGRKAMRPLAFSTAAVYQQDQSILDRDLARLGDVADRIDARYWIVSPDDYDHESASEQIREAVETYVLSRQRVFASGPVRIYLLQDEIR